MARREGSMMVGGRRSGVAFLVLFLGMLALMASTVTGGMAPLYYVGGLTLLLSALTLLFKSLVARGR